jgi:hypothetical protein
MVHREWLVQWRQTPRGLPALLALGLLAPLAGVAAGQSAPSQFRSDTDVRPRIPDEHDRPYFRETQSHRGWEIREPQYTVFADTSLADARWAAGHVAQAWQQASKLADRWAATPQDPTHRKPDFALNAVQIAISNEPTRDRDGPLTTLNVVGIQTQVQINIAPGQPGLEQQVARLREGAAFGMLHAAGLDAIAPPWVVAGMAAVAGRAGLTVQELQANVAVDQAARFGGQQWRYARGTQDTLAYPTANHEEAASRMAFLLTGDDAQHAPALFSLLKQAGADARQSAAVTDGFDVFPGDPKPASTNSVLDQLLSQHSQQFAAWKANPSGGLPIFEPTPGAPADVLAAEREMLVVLKLHQRFSNSVATTIESGAIRPKTITLDKAQGAVAKQLAARRAVPLTFASFVARLNDPAQGEWATLDTDGSLLLASDTQRVNELLSPAGGRYSLESKAGNSVLVRQTESGQTIRGWLEANPQDKTRPVAKFEWGGSTVRKPKIVEPANQGQVTLAP